MSVPAQFTAAALAPTYAIQLLGAILLAYGLVRLDLVNTVAGLVILLSAKAWYIDRQVLLFEDMKHRHSAPGGSTDRVPRDNAAPAALATGGYALGRRSDLHLRVRRASAQGEPRWP